jgi:hypothetical protein
VDRFPRQRIEMAPCHARRDNIPHMLERFGNVLYWVCATAAVVLTAIMLASVLTNDGADLTGIGTSILIGALIWFIGWTIRFIVSG